VRDIIRRDTQKARQRTEGTKREIIEGLGLFLLD
jgi:hypothetical protein